MERVRKPRMAKRKKITALHLDIFGGQIFLEYLLIFLEVKYFKLSLMRFHFLKSVGTSKPCVAFPDLWSAPLPLL